MTDPAPDRVGDESFPPAAQPPPGLIPGTLAACPTSCTPRPRDQRTYGAACHAAEGDPVAEFDACEIVPGMLAWCGSRFLPVVEVKHLTIGDIADPIAASETSRRHPFVLLRLADGGGTGWIIGELDAPVYVLA